MLCKNQCWFLSCWYLLEIPLVNHLLLAHTATSFQVYFTVFLYKQNSAHILHRLRIKIWDRFQHSMRCLIISILNSCHREFKSSCPNLVGALVARVSRHQISRSLEYWTSFDLALSRFFLFLKRCLVKYWNNPLDSNYKTCRALIWN